MSRSSLGDFTVGPRVLLLCAIAVPLGAVGAYVALALLDLIGFFTNLFFYHRLAFAFVSPAGNTLGPAVIVVPVVGALIIGFMARYGSEKIRGHGIPEAIEAILTNGSKVEPKVAILKPLSAAISIGSGGPFGAEGPIIMTGGAIGSVLAQSFHLTAAERKTLLVAGAAAGMSATFHTPVAAVLLAVELLLFEWKPRSFIPVALASATAAFVSAHLLGTGPLFPVGSSAFSGSPSALVACVLVGLAGGLLALVLTQAVYGAEDFFHRLPIHWMWWPALGAVVVGVGGWLFPQALGVGYDSIGALVAGDVPLRIVFGILIVKSVIWSVSLGSGTSGGVLAPLLMTGAALGSLEAHFLPHEGAGFWALISMGSVLGATICAPFTGVLFAFEVTHDVSALLPLLIGCTVAYGVTSLLLRRSILTEKIARRGLHLSREYAIDPLEILAVRESMTINSRALPIGAEPADVVAALESEQALYPVVDEESRVVAVVTRRALLEVGQRSTPFEQALVREPVVAYADEPLRVVVARMAESGRTRLPVVDDGMRLLGVVSLRSVLIARLGLLEAEQRRETVFHIVPPRGRLVEG